MKAEGLNFLLVDDFTRSINKRWSAVLRRIATLRKAYKDRYNISPNTILVGHEEDEIFLEYIVVHDLPIPENATTDGSSLLGCKIMKVQRSSYIQVCLINYDGENEE